MLKTTISGLALLLIASATVLAGEIDLEGVKCVVAPKNAQVSKSADYKKGKVYFCCGGCQGKFTKDSKPFAMKANQQLVSTKQYEQKACPLSGGDLDPETAIKVAGTKVAFCCGNCKAKVESSEDAEAMKLVFADKAFDKAFKKVEARKN